MRRAHLHPAEGGSVAARVVSVGRNSAWIALSGSDALHVASFRKGDGREQLVPGDLVEVRPLGDERFVVDRREARSFALVRRTPGGRDKTMAANIDGIAIVSSLANPAPHVAMLDELLAFGEVSGLASTLIFTKPDLAEPDTVAHLTSLYGAIGYPIFVVNPKRAQGVEPLARALLGRQTLLIGQSGVGKSSLFRALGGTANVGEVSREGRGRQTTTAGKLHYLPAGFLIDSPGVAEFQLHGSAPREVAGGFPEFAVPAQTCRFADCSHRGEPSCGVRSAVPGEIASSRYASYLGILARGFRSAAWSSA